MARLNPRSRRMQERLPPELAKVCHEASHPFVTRFELGTTEEGSWIVRAYVRAADEDAEADVRRAFGPFARRLRFVREEPPVPMARPAFPGRGE
jgi:hypothetical protein